MEPVAGETAASSRVTQPEAREDALMARILRLVAAGTVALAAAASTSACGGNDDNSMTVTTEVISDPTTQSIQVLAPETKGSWPVVLMLHGLNGKGEDMVELGSRIARAGALVYAPSYNTDLSTPEGFARTSEDLVCAYQLALRTAADHGGDVTKPLTIVGWSLGADLAMLGALGSGENESTRCPGDLTRPRVVIGLSGCYYEFDSNPVTWFDDLNGWGNKTARVYMTNGDRDTVCPAWQTDKLTTSLRGAGYQVEVVPLKNANHFAPVFHDLQGEDWRVISKNPPGDAVVATILDAMTTAGALTKS